MGAAWLRKGPSGGVRAGRRGLCTPDIEKEIASGADAIQSEVSASAAQVSRDSSGAMLGTWVFLIYFFFFCCCPDSSYLPGRGLFPVTCRPKPLPPGCPALPALARPPDPQAVTPNPAVRRALGCPPAPSLAGPGASQRVPRGQLSLPQTRLRASSRKGTGHSQSGGKSSPRVLRCLTSSGPGVSPGWVARGPPRSGTTSALGVGAGPGLLAAQSQWPSEPSPGVRDAGVGGAA